MKGRKREDRIYSNDMKKDKLAAALNIIHKLLNPVTQRWTLIGTTSLYLQGIAVEPHDIDILCSASDALVISKLLSAYEIPNAHNISRDKLRSVFSNYKINDIDVELMGDLEVKTNNGWVNLLHHINSTEEIIFENRVYKVPSKTDQETIYHLFGREKDQRVLELIRDAKIF